MNTESLMPEGTLVKELEMPVRWGHMDAFKHVNNTMYFRYFENVRLDWFESFDYAPLRNGDESMVIVDNHAEYLLPIVYPADMLIRMGAHSVGRSSFQSTYTISVGNKLMTRGSAKVVWLNSHTLKSAPLPDYVKQLIEPGA